MKNQWLVRWMAVAMMVGPMIGIAGEAYFVVKVQGMDKQVETSVMSATEFKELDKTIQQENRYFQAALAAAAKAWREDESNKGTSFAGGRVSPRKILGAPERFGSQEKAQEKLTLIEEMESKKADRLAEREIARAKSGKAEKSKEEIARERKKEMDLLAAVELVQAKLNELMGKAGGAPAAGGGAAKPPDAAAVEAGKKAL